MEIPSVHLGFIYLAISCPMSNRRQPEEAGKLHPSQNDKEELTWHPDGEWDSGLAQLYRSCWFRGSVLDGPGAFP